MYREMKSETPEWKKEIAEKVKAYGERKKRLTTPPDALKPGAENFREEKIETPRAIPVFTKPPEIKIAESIEERPIPIIRERVVSNPEPPMAVPEPKVDPIPQPKVAPPPQPKPPKIEVAKQAPVYESKPAPPVVESVAPPAVEIWTDDLESFASFEEPEGLNVEEHAATGAPYASRRLVAGIIDHTILIVLMIVFMGAFSLLTGESMEIQIASPWRVTFPAFLIVHFIYFLYFFRATRQTPGMVFLSLELRDPGSSVIPFGKVLARWIVMVGANIFNFLPVLMGKKFLLMDLISATEMRSFK
jgi:RDD family protein